MDNEVNVKVLIDIPDLRMATDLFFTTSYKAQEIVKGFLPISLLREIQEYVLQFKPRRNFSPAEFADPLPVLPAAPGSNLPAKYVRARIRPIFLRRGQLQEGPQESWYVPIPMADMTKAEAERVVSLHMKDIGLPVVFQRWLLSDCAEDDVSGSLEEHVSCLRRKATSLAEAVKQFQKQVEAETVATRRSVASGQSSSSRT